MGTSYSARTWLLIPIEPSELLIMGSVLETICDHPEMTIGMRFCPGCATPADNRTEEKQGIRIRPDHIYSSRVDDSEYETVDGAVSDIINSEYKYGREGAVITRAESHPEYDSDELFLGIEISGTDYDNLTVDVSVQRITDKTLALMRTAQKMGLPDDRPIIHRTLLEYG